MSIPVKSTVHGCGAIQRYRTLTEFIINRVVFCEHLITNCKTMFHSIKACSLGHRFTC